MFKEYQYGRDLKNRTLAEAVGNLWAIHDDLCSVVRELEDEGRLVSYRGIGKKFSEVIEKVEGLICCVEDADRFTKRQLKRIAK